MEEEGGRRRYKDGKREYEELCKRKKEEENERWEKEAEQARTERTNVLCILKII